MTIPVSTAPAAKAWLVGQLQTAITAASGHTLQVLYDHITDAATVPDDAVFVGDITNRLLQPLAFVGGQGASAFTETYRIEVTIAVSRPNITSQGVDERAWALLADVETVTRTDPTFGGLLTTSKPVETGSNITTVSNGTGVKCTLAWAVECLAEL